MVELSASDEITGREDAELRVRLEEYKALRAEIAERLKAQLVIVSGNVALSASVVALLRTFGEHRPIFLLLVPFISVIAGLLFLNQDASIVPLAIYQQEELGPALQRLTRASGQPLILGWEEFLREWRSSPRGRWAYRLGAFGLALVLAPALLILGTSAAAYLASGPFRAATHGGEYALAAFDLALVLGLLVTAASLNRGYRSIPGQPPHRADQRPERPRKPRNDDR